MFCMKHFSRRRHSQLEVERSRVLKAFEDRCSFRAFVLTVEVDVPNQVQGQTSGRKNSRPTWYWGYVIPRKSV